MSAVCFEGLRHLNGQFSSRGEHEYLWILAFVLLQPVEQRQSESGGFAGSGLGLANDIFARQHMGNNLLLNGGGGFVSSVADGLEQGGGKAHVGKRKRCSFIQRRHNNTFTERVDSKGELIVQSLPGKE